MLGLYVWMRDFLTHFRDEQSGQDAFEYLLVIGGVSVAVIVAVATPVGGAIINSVVKGMCEAIASIPKMTAVSC